jgi:hypothetical protein
MMEFGMVFDIQYQMPIPIPKYQKNWYSIPIPIPKYQKNWYPIPIPIPKYQKNWYSIPIPIPKYQKSSYLKIKRLKNFRNSGIFTVNFSNLVEI